MSEIFWWLCYSATGGGFGDHNTFSVHLVIFSFSSLIIARLFYFIFILCSFIVDLNSF
ncbi:hypothetical protein BDW67DRAFT_164387 [Aspergillus spinulosporus]